MKKHILILILLNSLSLVAAQQAEKKEKVEMVDKAVQTYYLGQIALQSMICDCRRNFINLSHSSPCAIKKSNSNEKDEFDFDWNEMRRYSFKPKRKRYFKKWN